MMESSFRRGVVAVLSSCFALVVAVASDAAEVKIARTTGASAFLEGKAEGVSIDRLGILRLAERLELQAEIGEPFLLSAAAHPRGWVVGTGNSGRVFLIDASRAAGDRVHQLLEADEEEVFAVLATDDGTVFAGSSPEGKLYRITPDGEVFVVFETGETYIWALARDERGRLYVGTGTNGKLFRVTLAQGDDQSATVEELYDASDPHVRSLIYRPGSSASEQGLLYAGTAGEGRILRIDGQGRVVSLYDADQPEITALALGPDGDLFAAAVASEASLVDLQPARPPASGRDSSESDESSGEPQVQVSESQTSAGSRPSGYKGPRSDLVRIRANGSAESLGTLRRDTAYSLLWNGRLWVGTGQQGKLYSVRDQELVLEHDLDSRQLMALLPIPGRDGIAVAATDSAALFATGDEKVSSGTYSSDVLDARYGSRFGTLHWEGELPSGSRIGFELRTGFSASPDDTWSDWSAVGDARAGELSGSLSLDAAEVGRYAQWRATLEPGADEASPELRAVEISYLQQNRRPEIEALEVLDAGEVLVAANFNPSNQAFEALTPNRDGVFTRIGDPTSDGRTKKLWKLGYRTLRWQAEDPNGDELHYSLWVRPESSDLWYAIEEELEQTHLGFDATVLPDGRYRFKLVASDAPSNGDEAALAAERLTGSIVIDHSAPELRGVTEGADGVVEVLVEDALLPLRDLEYSVDAEEWLEVEPLDGLIDSRRESVRLRIPETASMVLLRLVDGAFNQRTVDVLAARSAERQARDRRSGAAERRDRR